MIELVTSGVDDPFVLTKREFPAPGWLVEGCRAWYLGEGENLVDHLAGYLRKELEAERETEKEIHLPSDGWTVEVSDEVAAMFPRSPAKAVHPDGEVG